MPKSPNLTAFANTLLSSAERTKILGGLWYDVAVQLHDDASSRFVADGDVKKYFWSCHFRLISLFGFILINNNN